MASYESGTIPPLVEQLFAGRAQDRLPPDALVRVQQIGMTPSISSNYRYVLMSDGRLFYAANSACPPADRQQRFNTSLPDQPTVTLPAETVADINAALSAESFFEQPPYLADTHIRDGSLIIVTAQRDHEQHEVWYQNVSTELTDRLCSIQIEIDSSETGPAKLLNDLQVLNRLLEEE